MGSEEVRLDPLTGNFSRISVLDGNFVEVSKGDPNFPTYSDTRWEPFQEWMMANYPDDWQFLRADSSWHTEESFRLWDQRITEYVEAKTSS